MMALKTNRPLIGSIGAMLVIKFGSRRIYYYICLCLLLLETSNTLNNTTFIHTYFVTKYKTIL